MGIIKLNFTVATFIMQGLYYFTISNVLDYFTDDLIRQDVVNRQ